MELQGDKIGYACVVAEQFPNQRTISFQCNFAQGATAEEMNKEMDKLAAVLDRQAMRIQIPTLKHAMEVKRRNLKNQEDQLASFQATLAEAVSDTSSRKVSNVPTIKTNYENGLVTYTRLKAELEADDAALKELEQKAA